MKSFPPVFNIRFASFIKSSTRSAIRAKQKTTASTAFVSRGVLRTSQAVTRSLCFTRSNEWTLNLRSIFRVFSEEKKNCELVCFFLDRLSKTSHNTILTLCFKEADNLASPQPMSTMIWFFGSFFSI
jgi:hypothetical protein